MPFFRKVFFHVGVSDFSGLLMVFDECTIFLGAGWAHNVFSLDYDVLMTHCDEEGGTPIWLDRSCLSLM